MPDKMFRSETLSGAKRWINTNYKVKEHAVSQQLRDALWDGLNDRKMDAMWERHKGTDKIVVLFNDEHVDMGTVVKKLGFQNKDDPDPTKIKNFAELFEIGRTWTFNYNA